MDYVDSLMLFSSILNLFIFVGDESTVWFIDDLFIQFSSYVEQGITNAKFIRTVITDIPAINNFKEIELVLNYYTSFVFYICNNIPTSLNYVKQTQ